jgi:hypothetical protein
MKCKFLARDYDVIGTKDGYYFVEFGTETKPWSVWIPKDVVQISSLPCLVDAVARYFCIANPYIFFTVEGDFVGIGISDFKHMPPKPVYHRPGCMGASRYNPLDDLIKLVGEVCDVDEYKCKIDKLHQDLFAK